ncbi:hypothetical protein BSLG_008530 [Batrachochytrium salamandrivorans]|nr:hypothetical protein BSLG_008530 [Batrachochytrium salamandrivorans]
MLATGSSSHHGADSNNAPTQRINYARVPDIVDQLAADLQTLHHDEIVDILAQADLLAHYSLELSLVDYIETNGFLSSLLVREPSQMLKLLNSSLVLAQQQILTLHPLSNHLTVKHNCHVRITRPNDCKELVRSRVPRCADLGRLVFFKGTVIRTGMVKMLETRKSYLCVAGCGQLFSVAYDREQHNAIAKPVKCAAERVGLEETCAGTKFAEIPNDATHLSTVCKDYQEIKVQEQVTKLAMGTIPRSIVVILEDDLVDECKAGDDIWVTGTVIRRWKSLAPNERCDIEIAMYANNIRLNNQTLTNTLLTDETKKWFEDFWIEHHDTPISGRNLIIQSFCPKVVGLFAIKIAIMLLLVGGVPKYENGLKIRGDSHILLVGDPGTGKSQFLRYAAQLSNRSVLTTGIGSTSAGLTVSANRDSGEWQLEAGALVLADRGLCCIDEFGGIRENDKAAIHEAMEQQAGLVCKLNTRCSILASTNPKGKYDPSQGIEVNIALASPLLSRFDLILLLLDTQNPEWDQIVSSFILDTETNGRPPLATAGELWDLERLQAYICYIKETFSPKLTEDANNVLKKYYQLQRGSDLRHSARTTARLMCQNEVLLRDAVIAISIVEASIHSMALLKSVSTMHAPFPKDPEKDYANTEAIILNRLGLVIPPSNQFEAAPFERSRNNSGRSTKAMNDIGLFSIDQDDTLLHMEHDFGTAPSSFRTLHTPFTAPYLDCRNNTQSLKPSSPHDPCRNLQEEDIDPLLVDQGSLEGLENYVSQSDVVSWPATPPPVQLLLPNTDSLHEQVAEMSATFDNGEDPIFANVAFFEEPSRCKVDLESTNLIPGNEIHGSYASKRDNATLELITDIGEGVDPLITHSALSSSADRDLETLSTTPPKAMTGGSPTDTLHPHPNGILQHSELPLRDMPVHHSCDTGNSESLMTRALSVGGGGENAQDTNPSAHPTTHYTHNAGTAGDLSSVLDLDDVSEDAPTGKRFGLSQFRYRPQQRQSSTFGTASNVECPSSQSEATAQVLQTAAGTSDIASTRIDMPVTSRVGQAFRFYTSVFSPAQNKHGSIAAILANALAGASTPQPAASTASAASAASTTASLMNMNHDMDEEMLLFDSPSPSAMWALSDNQDPLHVVRGFDQTPTSRRRGPGALPTLDQETVDLFGMDTPVSRIGSTRMTTGHSTPSPVHMLLGGMDRDSSDSASFNLGAGVGARESSRHDVGAPLLVRKPKRFK